MPKANKETDARVTTRVREDGTIITETWLDSRGYPHSKYITKVKMPENNNIKKEYHINYPMKHEICKKKDVNNYEPLIKQTTWSSACPGLLFVKVGLHMNPLGQPM